MSDFMDNVLAAESADEALDIIAEEASAYRAYSAQKAYLTVRAFRALWQEKEDLKGEARRHDDLIDLMRVLAGISNNLSDLTRLPIKVETGQPKCRDVRTFESGVAHEQARIVALIEGKFGPNDVPYRAGFNRAIDDCLRAIQTNEGEKP